MKNIVFSGINLFEGGPLSIFKDCLNSVVENELHKSNNIIAFVHKKELFKEFQEEITIIELPKSRKNYLYRLWYEYFYFYAYSFRANIDIWVSLHDITPNVKAKKRLVYCHNASPFYKMSKMESEFAPKLKFFNLLYKYIYLINLKKNDYVILQQHWLKNKFIETFNINSNKIIVAHPNTQNLKEALIRNDSLPVNNMFFYPSFPRAFKNFEVICEASLILANKGITDYKIVLTLDGTENRYSSYLVNKYQKHNNIIFIGLQSRNKVYSYYEKCSALIFPSKLESWGLPISEVKTFNKPIIAARLDYAVETVGEYNQVKFFNPNDADELAEILERFIKKTIKWEKGTNEFTPDFASWDKLIKKIFQ